MEYSGKETVGNVPESVSNLGESLRKLLADKLDSIGSLFSQEEVDSINELTLKILKEGYIPDWILAVGAIGAERADGFLDLRINGISKEDARKRFIQNEADHQLKSLQAKRRSK